MTTDLRQVWLRLAAVAVLALPGCAYLQGQVAADSEEILAQAGFQRQPLDEPGLPSRQLVEAAGTYKFADPDFCQCMYVGGASEYAELQRLRAERVADARLDAAPRLVWATPTTMTSGVRGSPRAWTSSGRRSRGR